MALFKSKTTKNSRVPKNYKAKNNKKSRKLSFSRFNFQQKLLMGVFATFFLLVGGYAAYQYSSAATPTNPYVCAEAHPTLSQGSVGNCVKHLQWYLNAYASQGLVIDGNFGTKTKAAVTNVQLFFGLRADGVAGKDTWGILHYIKVTKTGVVYSNAKVDIIMCKSSDNRGVKMAAKNKTTQLMYRANITRPNGQGLYVEYINPGQTKRQASYVYSAYAGSETMKVGIGFNQTNQGFENIYQGSYTSTAISALPLCN